MGLTDFEIMAKYTPKIADILNDLDEGSRVAWLGQQPPGGDHLHLYNSIMSGVVPNLEHHFYDLNIANGPKCFTWDVNEKWNIQGYDLILGLRVLYLCESVKLLRENLKNICSNNDKVVFDFMTGNPSHTGSQEVFIKKNNSRTLLPLFGEYYGDIECCVMPNHEDQALFLSHLQEDNITVKNLLTFRDSVKGRFYSICELNNAT